MDKNEAAYNGRPIWCGSVNLLDGEIEEVHSYEEAQAMDFHHSLYFSEAQVEKMAGGECAFFWIDSGQVEVNWRERCDPAVAQRLTAQLSFIGQPEAVELSAPTLC